MNKGGRIFVSCALGAMVGLTVALKVPEMVWWLGALVGAVASGGIYAWREIWLNSRKAAELSWRGLSLLPRLWASVSLAAKYQLLASGCLIMSFFFWGLISIPFEKVWTRELTISVVLMCAVQFFGAFIYSLYSNGDQYLSQQEYLARSKRYLILSTPIGLLVIVYVTLKHLPRAVAKTAVFTWREILPFLVFILVLYVKMWVEVVKFCFNFTKNLFILIHSRELVLCFVDGGLGVVISYLWFAQAWNLDPGPTVLSGGLLGGLLGIVNYELISKRVLHLAV